MYRRNVLIAGAVASLTTAVIATRCGMRWGATQPEIEEAGTGGEWLEGLPGRRIRMTRAISIAAPPATVWPWLAQMGRGAGWYSFDGFDNGGRASARHIVGWVPAPQLGDATAIGYLRALTPGRELVWWAPETRFLGAQTWSLFGYRLVAEEDGTRVVMRVDAVASGPAGRVVAVVFPVVDSVMALRQLANLRNRAERLGGRAEDPDRPETGERDQYQLHHVIYASGDQAGVPGSENARGSRASAEAAGVL